MLKLKMAKRLQLQNELTPQNRIPYPLIFMSPTRFIIGSTGHEASSNRDNSKAGNFPTVFNQVESMMRDLL